jgi:cytoskeletal protein RodZ
MKTVGKQLQEARLARNWTPELAARETKIKVDRLRDLEGDDYSHFTSPTDARGFVRTYARALGLDEYKILRQLDNKLPDDDSANIVTDSGVAYLPETAMPPRAAHRDYTGLYIVMGLGAVVTLAIVFVLFEAYRVGELSNWFASSPDTVATATSGTNADGTPASPTAVTDNRAKPIDSNTPPPIVEATNAPTDAAPVAPGLTSPRALPVNPSDLGIGGTNTDAAPMQAVKALPVDPSELTNGVPATPDGPASGVTKAPPRALPVDPSELTNAAPVTAGATTTVALNAPPAAPPVPHPSSTARQSNSGPVMEPSLPPVAPVTESAPATPIAPAVTTNAAPQTTATPPAVNKRLVLTASQDSFVRVTNLDAPDADKPLYAGVLHGGDSVGFDGHKFSINVGVPSAVGIKLDGVNYGPHSDQAAPETFTVQSHQP